MRADGLAVLSVCYKLRSYEFKVHDNGIGVGRVELGRYFDNSKYGKSKSKDAYRFEDIAQFKAGISTCMKLPILTQVAMFTIVKKAMLCSFHASLPPSTHVILEIPP